MQKEQFDHWWTDEYTDSNRPYQGYQMQMPYVGMQRPIAQVIPSYPGYAPPNLNQ